MIIIVTTLYNAEKYIGKCIDSIKCQSYESFKCYITDDLSTDDSIQIAKRTIDRDNRFILLKNNCKAYQPGNYDYVIRNNKDIDDNDIIVELDGDDWFPDENVLKRVNQVYQDDNVWIANGSFIYSNGQPGFATEQQINSNLRSARMTCSHLRTWRAGLWRKIKQEDLKNEHGVYWPVTGDLAFMFPMLEMAGQEHYRFMKEINYVYNGDNPLNDHKVDLGLVNEVAHTIRAMEPYKKL